MRKIVCRFKDESDFLRHLRPGISSSGPEALAFLGTFDLEVGSELDVSVMISNVRERCKLRMRIVEKMPAGLDDGRGPARVWRYRAQVTGQDRVWLEMFVTKIRTLTRVELQAAA